MSLPKRVDCPSIYDLEYDELEALVFNQWNQPKYRSGQLWTGLYQQFWLSPVDFSTLPTDLRQTISQTYSPLFTLNNKRSLTSVDNQTEKVLFTLPDNVAIETVLMRYSERNTICVSTQAGCPIGCVFCATGQMGFKRNLSCGEIIQQILYFANELKKTGEVITNIVLMGMGEPFLNYEQTLTAIKRLSRPDTLGLSERRFTISTVGIPEKIVHFGQEHHQINLAVSLHAATDDLRSSLIPINKKYPIEDIIKACKTYIEMTRRRVSFEWALIKGVNDTDKQINEMIHLLKGMLCHVNLIPLNPSPSYNAQPTQEITVNLIRERLERNGIPCTIRLKRGIEIQAGCGQLATQILREGMI